MERDQRYDGRAGSRRRNPYSNEDWDVEGDQSEEQYHYHHRSQSRRVGRSDQLTSTSSNPRQNFGRIDDDESTGDGDSSVVSYASGYGRTSKHISNNRDNYYEPTVRVHYVPQQEYYADPIRSPTYQTPTPSRMPEIPERFRDERDESEMYVTDSAFTKQRPPGSIYSHYSGKSRAPSELSSVKTKTSRKGGVVVETMAAPNPFCPNTKGVCCLMVLVNLGLILVTLGFSIVLQLYDPPFVWYCGIAFLIVGFIGLIASLVFCVYLCRESREIRRARGTQPGELYWTHHWQKRIPIPGMGSRSDREKDDLSTVYSARTDYEDPHHQSEKFYSRNENDRRHHKDMTPVHSYRN